MLQVMDAKTRGSGRSRRTHDTHRPPETAARRRGVAGLRSLGALVAMLLAGPAVLLLAPPAQAARPDVPSTAPAQRVQPGVMLVPKPRAGEERYGVDVSWPQCGGPLPAIPLDFVVVGLTNGHARSISPCLAGQAAWAASVRANVSVYVVPNAPDAPTYQRGELWARTADRCPVAAPRCASYGAGVVQAQHALRAAARLHLTPRSWWLDVEDTPGRTLWSADTFANVAVLRGWVDTVRAAGRRVGVYSTAGYWQMVTGGWQVDLAQWVAVGEAGIDAAREACGEPFTAGPVLLTQWLTGPLDGDLVCPGHRAMAVAFLHAWHRTRTAGVPALLTIPVPHPHPVATPKHHRRPHHRHHHDHPGATTKHAATSHAAAQPPQPRPAPSPHAQPGRQPSATAPPVTATPHPAPAPPAPPRPAPSHAPAPAPSGTAMPPEPQPSTPEGSSGDAVPAPAPASPAEVGMETPAPVV